jgi:8-oxo-dGTP pyrophosphatase MutT (NUDIX family)
LSSFYYRDQSAPKPNQPQRISVTALIESDNRLLLDWRADAPLWGLIAGALETEETLADALRREVREETGLEIRSFSFFGTFSDPSRIAQYADGNVRRLVTLAYIVEVEDASVLHVSPESLDLRFFARHELPLDELVAPHRPIIDRYLSGDAPPFLD